MKCLAFELHPPMVRSQEFEDEDDNEYEDEREGLRLPQKFHGPRVFLRDRQPLASGLILQQQSEPFS
jgi:hypothetical protein